MKLEAFYSQKMLQSLVVLKGSSLEKKMLVCYRDNNKYLGFIEYDPIQSLFYSFDALGKYRVHPNDRMAIARLVMADLVKEMKDA